MKKDQEIKYLRDLGEELERLSIQESIDRKNALIKFIIIAAAVLIGLFFAMKGFRNQAFFLTLFVVVGVEFFDKITFLWFTCTYHRWPVTEGKIITQPKVVEVVRTRSGVFCSACSSFLPADTTPPIRYKVAVKYEYEVGMDTYTGRRISFSEQIWYSQKDAQKQADEFKRGGEVTVRYHPMWPKISIAES
ncbi:hypothetical protein QA601_14740 [Chitinispirillales bacterium ANBcel5]|uniref:DUF3592 domain-containing protein n=1 Tax=Cellulosispirillum alkaliphilum TaxID=3039283 RepID=UPI002A583634|nr:hypothetical protein [Chitinispirillales bacterium ANBcel5]